jgi:hypothetical protein
MILKTQKNILYIYILYILLKKIIKKIKKQFQKKQTFAKKNKI